MRPHSPPPDRAVDRPPLDSEWISHQPLAEVYQAVADLRGMTGLRRVVKDSVGASHKLAQPMIQGLSRLFGATPTSHLEMATREGIDTRAVYHVRW